MTSIYYLSFQRQPPKSVKGDEESILISPIIHNDLREDVYSETDYEPVPITVAWLAETSIMSGEGQMKFVLIKEEFVVDWIDSSQAYKNVQINLPSKKDLKGISNLRLVLYVKRQESRIDGIEAWQYSPKQIVDNQQQTFFVPIISAPIKMSSLKGSSTIGLGRQFLIGNKSIFMEENSGFDLEGHIWDAALHMVHWIENSSSELGLVKSNDARQLQILELGAGTGFVSIALRCLLKKRNKSFISATDLTSAMEVLQRNVKINDGKNKIDVNVLDWQEIPKSYENRFDFILIADCTYNPSYFEPLCKAIKTCLKSTSPKGICFLAKKHRHIDEDSLWTFIKNAGLKYELIFGNDPKLAKGSEFDYTGWGLYKIQHV